MRIIADNKIPYLKGVLEPYAEVIYMPGTSINANAVKNADALIVRTRTICNKALLEGSDVKFIATATIGFDHIDTQWCEQNGIIWTNAPGCNSGSVMQYIASLLVFLSKKHNFKFEDKTLGVVGVGNVGWKIVRLAEALGMRVVMNDPPIVRQRGICGYVSLDGLLREADIITLHVPLNHDGVDKTYHLFDSNLLRKTLPGTILVNSSRGEVVDNSALHEFIDNKHLLGASLDVWEHEPNIDVELLKKIDIATPHIAGYSADGKETATKMSVLALSRFFRLGIEWKQSQIQKPINQEFVLDCAGKDIQKIMCRAIEMTYRVENDDLTLRNNVNLFEEHRGNYPLRREFNAYNITILNGSKDVKDNLKILGFKINEE